MASRQSVSSILKPSKVRAPLKEIEPVDQDADENTESLPKRKVSFSGMNKIKMYNTGATSLTVHQAPMFDEQISILSDSSNAEKTKLLLEASQKSNQTTIESRNCTNIEDNNRVCVEYECQNDNMEMTEALSCKIFSDTIYTNENNGFEHGDYNSDYSDSNMEFTGVIKTAQILTNENDSDFSSTEILNDNNKHHDAQSSNMELTCVTSFQKSILPHCKSDMELTELTDRKIHENNCELVFEQDQHSISTTSEMSSDISMDIDQTSEGNDINCIIDSSKLLVSEPNDSLIPKPTEYEQHNYSDLLIDIDNQNIQPSPSLVSTGLSFISEMLDSNKPSRVEELKQDILNTNTSTVDQYHSSENNEIKSYSRKSMAHTNTFIVDEKSSKNKYVLNTSVVVKENDQKNYFIESQTVSLEKENTLNTSVLLEKNQQINALVSIHNGSDSPVVVKSQQKRSRKSIAPTLFHNQSPENYELSNTPVILEENQQKIYSQQSNASVLVHHESQFSETLNTQSTLEENQQKRSRKSIAPTLFHNEYQSSKNDELLNTPVMLGENQQKRYSRKSIVPTLFHNESQSSENDEISNTSIMLEENQQKIYSQQSNVSVLVHHESQSSENDETLNTLSTLEENQQKRYSRKSIAPTLFHNESQSSENDEISNTHIMLTENQQKRYSQQSNAPVLIHNGSSQSSESDETLNTLSTLEEKQQNKYSRKSVAPLSIHNESKSSKDENNVPDSPVVVKSQQKKYSRKSFAPALFNIESQSSENNEISNAPVLIHNESQSYEDEDQSNASMSLHNESQSFGDEDISDTPVVVEENQHKIYCRKSIVPTLDFNESKFSEIEGMSNQTRSPIVRDLLDTSVTVRANRPKKYSRKTVGPSSLLVHREPPKYIECDNNIMDEEESSKSNSRMSMTCVTTKCISDISCLSDYSNTHLPDLSDEHKDKFISKTELKPVFSNMIVDDDLNSPFRKKSRLSVAHTNLKSETVFENKALENYGETITMDISVDLSNDNSMLNISSKELHVSSPSCLLNDISHSLVLKNNLFEEKSEVSDKSSRKEQYLNDLTENIEKLEKVKNDSLQISDNSNMVNHSLKFQDNSIPHNINRRVNDICTEDLSNISISDKTHTNYEKSFTGNRKRSYTNRDINYEESAMEKDFEVVSIKEDSLNENLNNEVIEFLEKWEKQFIDKILVKVKCTNSKWIFKALNDNIVLTIKYFPILKDHNFLKVEDISFTTKNIIQHEIIKFGINWILSKYDPKVYKQVCFSSRDIELLLKSLLEDLKYISKMINNMFYVSDMYCVKFKDNLAQFCLYSMKCLSMTSIQISLANIHKLSVKDITVNCLFGSFNINLLNEILKELPKDYNILESLIVKLKDQMYR